MFVVLALHEIPLLGCGRYNFMFVHNRWGIGKVEELLAYCALLESGDGFLLHGRCVRLGAV